MQIPFIKFKAVPCRLLSYLLLFVFIVSCDEKITSNFRSYDEMKVSQSYQNGWIPDVIPKESLDIFEIHDLDTNSVFIKFHCPGDLKSKDLKLLNDFQVLEYQTEFIKSFVKGDSNYLISAYDYNGADRLGNSRFGRLLKLKSNHLCFYFDGAN